jgi:hypothetical protein
MEQEEESDRLFLTFSAEELGTIVVLIIKGVDKSIAVRAMPRYTSEQHQEYQAFFEQLQEAIDWAWYGK